MLLAHHTCQLCCIYCQWIVVNHLLLVSNYAPDICKYTLLLCRSHTTAYWQYQYAVLVAAVGITAQAWRCRGTERSGRAVTSSHITQFAPDQVPSRASNCGSTLVARMWCHRPPGPLPGSMICCSLQQRHHQYGHPGQNHLSFMAAVSLACRWRSWDGRCCDYLV